jgi:hypothetical protein
MCGVTGLNGAHSLRLRSRYCRDKTGYEYTKPLRPFQTAAWPPVNFGDRLNIDHRDSMKRFLGEILVLSSRQSTDKTSCDRETRMSSKLGHLGLALTALCPFPCLLRHNLTNRQKKSLPFVFHSSDAGRMVRLGHSPRQKGRQRRCGWARQRPECLHITSLTPPAVFSPPVAGTALEDMERVDRI